MMCVLSPDSRCLADGLNPVQCTCTLLHLFSLEASCVRFASA